MIKDNIKVYNSLTNKMENFKPIKDDEISMYVCGPTVYNLLILTIKLLKRQ